MTKMAPQGARCALLLVVWAGLLSACTTTTLVVDDGVEHELQLTDSDLRYIYGEDQSGEVRAVPRENVTYIDHPGNVLALVGGILFLAGAEWAVLAFDGSFIRDPTDVATIGTIGLTHAVAGVTMFGVGLSHWLASQQMLRPTLSPDGIALQLSF